MESKVSKNVEKENLDIEFANKVSKEEKRRMLAKKLKLKLESRNISSSNFAEMLGKRPSEISKWLSGNHNFTLDTIFEIEERLGETLINVDPHKTVKNGFRELAIYDQAESSEITIELAKLYRRLLDTTQDTSILLNSKSKI